MEIQTTFTSADQLVKYLKTLKPADHFRIAKSVGVKPKDKAEAHLFADYIVQGTSKGLTGEDLVKYAQSNVERLQAIMPHLKGQVQPQAVPETPSVAKPTTKPAKVAKEPKAPKAPKAPKKVKLKYEDFTIVARPDRGGFEGWYGGKAEAFRPTADKVEAFFTKKYDRKGPFNVVQ
jgi:hypothetical protein